MKAQRLVQLVLFAVLALSLLVNCNKASGPNQTLDKLTVRSVEVVDSEGRTIAAIEENDSLPGNAIIALLDAQGIAKCIISSTDQGGQIVVNNQVGETIAAILSWNRGGALHLTDGMEGQIFEASAGANGASTTLSVEHVDAAAGRTRYPKHYDFLNDVANQAVILNLADWTLLRMIARFNCREALTDDLIKTSFDAAWGGANTKLVVVVNTEPQPALSSSHLGRGRFSLTDRDLKAVCSKAFSQILRSVSTECGSLGVDPAHIKVVLLVNGFEIASWTNSSIQLKGEESMKTLE